MTDYMKTFVLIPRRKDISREEFHDHWRHPHGSWGKYMGGMPRYAQCHQIDCSLLGPEQTVFEGVVEAWAAGVDEAAALPKEPLYLAYIKPDEQNFIDLPGLTFFMTHEEQIHPSRSFVDLDNPNTIWSPWRAPVAIKLLQLIQPGSDADWARDEDAQLGHALGALWHVRCRPVREVHGATPPYIGVRELWWPHMSAFKEGVKSAAAWRDLIQRPKKAITLLGQYELGQDYIIDRSKLPSFDKASRLEK